MIHAIHIATDAGLEAELAPAIDNPAIAHCLQVWRATRTESLAAGKSEFYSGRDAALAYLAALPPLCGAGNIAGFIACIGYALALQIIPTKRAASLLSAARIASSTTVKEAKTASSKS